MPKQSSNAKATTSSSGDTSATKSDYYYTKPYGGMQGFMHSYGLKMYNDDDVQEAKAIIDGFRQLDAADAEAGKADSK
ncbi:hypothetical protein BJV78DRAFT_1234696 [Lactifluus subvellereus]|nr:hypothetical protein BJV78DRAFT_1234696 [Lactifluus subvellereus]